MRLKTQKPGLFTRFVLLALSLIFVLALPTPSFFASGLAPAKTTLVTSPTLAIDENYLLISVYERTKPTVAAFLAAGMKPHVIDELYAASSQVYSLKDLRPSSSDVISADYIADLNALSAASKLLDLKGFTKGFTVNSALIGSTCSMDGLQNQDVIVSLNGRRFTRDIFWEDYLIRKVAFKNNKPVVARVFSPRTEMFRNVTLNMGFSVANTWCSLIEVNFNPNVFHRSEQGYMSGSSRTLVTALGFYQGLSGKPLAGNMLVSGSGKLDFEGNVGTIGAPDAKAYLAYKSKADVFFVHPSQVSAAQAAAPGLNVVGVDTLKQAVDYLKNM